jgi:hypothetical protein
MERRIVPIISAASDPGCREATKSFRLKQAYGGKGEPHLPVPCRLTNAQTPSRVPNFAIIGFLTLRLKAPTESPAPANLKNPAKDGSSNGTSEPYARRGPKPNDSEVGVIAETKQLIARQY